MKMLSLSPLLDGLLLHLVFLIWNSLFRQFSTSFHSFFFNRSVMLPLLKKMEGCVDYWWQALLIITVEWFFREFSTVLNFLLGLLVCGVFFLSIFDLFPIRRGLMLLILMKSFWKGFKGLSFRISFSFFLLSLSFRDATRWLFLLKKPSLEMVELPRGLTLLGNTEVLMTSSS